MAPTIPPNFSSSRRGAGASDAPAVTEVIYVSSGPSVQDISSSSDVEEVTSMPRAAARRRRPSPAAPVVRSVSNFFARSPSSSPVRAPVSDDAASSDDDDAVPYQPRMEREVKRQKWKLDDELLVLATMVRLKEENCGVIPPASEVLDELLDIREFTRRGLYREALSDKIRALKKKYIDAVEKKRANVPPRPKRRRKTWKRNRELCSMSEQLWGEEVLLLGGDDANTDVQDPTI